MRKLAPIVLFVYNRPWHTEKTINALVSNELASSSELVVFSDGPKDQEANKDVHKVRALLKDIPGFKSVKIVERTENLGLAESIVRGVSEVIDKYGKVIVLEDDIVTSPAFLTFMNDSLFFYEHKKEVWHISGWNYPIELPGESQVFFWRIMNCWGWATWADRWRHYKKEPLRLIDSLDDSDKRNFDVGGQGFFWDQVTANAKGEINTWAIFWYATIFENKGMCLTPKKSYVYNSGLDGSGINCGKAGHFSTDALNTQKNLRLNPIVEESAISVLLLEQFLKKNFSSRLARFKKLFKRFIINNMVRCVTHSHTHAHT
jgi:hypothetical protein